MGGRWRKGFDGICLRAKTKFLAKKRRIATEADEYTRYTKYWDPVSGRKLGHNCVVERPYY